MLHRFSIPLCLSLMFLAACTPTTFPTLVPTLAPSPLPTSTPIPSPTPTATPIPLLALTIHWPEQVSALQPVPIEVDLLPPPGIVVTATVYAVVRIPGGGHYQSFDLQPAGDNRYISTEPLQLPLQAREGDWRLEVIVRSTVEVTGERRLLFRPAPVRFRDLTAVLPAGVTLLVPQNFEEVLASGDAVAGARVWRHGNGELGLWWAPGPAEPLLFNNALVMLETTYGLSAPAPSFEEMTWQGQTAFLFHEDWPGAEGGPGEALVVQGPDDWLYVLRVRALDGNEIPALLRMVGETFRFTGE